MNPTIERFGPPAIVLGLALYLGWPPASPLDLGDDLVNAKAVRWKVSDIEPPPEPTDLTDPFRAVLVADESMEVEPETGRLVESTKPAGPDPNDIETGLRISGIASFGGKQWAVVNGKPRLPGDVVFTSDSKQLRCEIVSVSNDHLVVRSEETFVTLRPKPFGSQTHGTKTTAPSTPPSVDSTTPVTVETPGETSKIPPPPPIDLPGVAPQA
ncbi:MAG: hypothetical protein HKN47_15570 [Pirellulaceae bacterium]|nr:hypothetical protein [Pirellulaceae bacterium]